MSQLIKSVVKLEGADRAKVESFIAGWKKIKDLPCEEVTLRENNSSIILEIYYPLDVFDHSVTQFISVIYGELSSAAPFGKITFQDLQLPNEVYKWFQGPKFGVEEIARRFSVKNWPLLMAIIKPSLGRDLKTANIDEKIKSVLTGGFHGIKDDEMQGNLPYAPLRERITLAKKYKKYVPAINLDSVDEYKQFLSGKENAQIGMIILNATTIGFPMLHELRKCTDVPIISHLALQGIYTSTFSPRVFAKLHRLFGCDAFITPVPNVGYFNISSEGQKEMIEEFTKDLPIKKTLPILGGGARLNNLPEVTRLCREANLPYGIVFGTLVFASEFDPTTACKLVTEQINKLNNL